MTSRYLKHAFMEAKISLFTHSYSVSRGMSKRAKKKAETSKYLLKIAKYIINRVSDLRIVGASLFLASCLSA